MKVVWKTFFVIVFVWLVFWLYKYIIKEVNGSFVKTEMALTSSITNSFNSEGLIVKKEILIKSESNKIVNYLVESGEKVAVGGNIANLYNNYKDVQSVYKLKNINDEIKLLNDVKLLKNNKNLITDVLYKQIFNNLSDLIVINNDKLLNGYNEKKCDLLISLIKKDIIYNKTSGINEKIKKLNYEKMMCEKNLSNSETIYSPATGYFSEKVDGYESLYFLNDVSDMEYGELLNILKKPKVKSSNGNIGKIFTGFDWYIIINTSKKNIDKLGGADVVNLDFNIYNCNNIPATVIDVKNNDTSNECILILKSNYISKEIMNLRRNNIKISTKSYYGIFVNVDAVRFINNHRGVFVKEGKKIKFKKIDLLFETNNKVISQVNMLDKDFLQPFDEVILEGQNLYDGKEIE